jgi:hypothetical protein
MVSEAWGFSPNTMSCDVSTNRQGSHDRFCRQAAFALLIAGGLLRILISCRDIAMLDTLLFPDDTYLSLGIARNIALGRGSTFDGEVLTNGYQPLYVWLMVPVYLLFPDDRVLPIHLALIMLSLAALLTGWLLYRIASRLGRPWHGLVVLAIYLFDPGMLRHSLNGLETGLALLGLAATTDWYLTRIRGRRAIPARHLLVLGVLAGLSVLARIDQAIFLAAVACDRLLEQCSWRAAWQLLLVGAVALAINLPWLMYGLSIGSGLLTDSGSAVHYNALTQVNSLTGYMLALFLLFLVSLTTPLSNLVLLIAGILAFVASRRRYRRKPQWLLAGLQRLRPLRAGVIFCLLTLLAYWLYIPAYWFFDRYMQPAALFLLLFGVLMLPDPEALGARRRRALGWATVGTTALMAGLSLRLLITTPKVDGYLQVARWANQNLPGQNLASYQIGAIGYWAEGVRIFDLDGVVDRTALAARREGRLGAELQRRDGHWLLDWNNPPGLASDNIRDMVRLQRPLPPEVKSWGASWYLFRVEPSP